MIICTTFIPRCVRCTERIWQWKFLTVGGLPLHWRCWIGFRPFPKTSP